MYFIVAHRFGSIENGFDDFFGLDIASNKIQLIYGLNDHINFGAARSSYQKTYALHTKLLILRQQIEKSPVTIGVYGQLTINNQLDLDLNPDLDFSHRLTYTAQALVSRKFSEKLSLQLSPTLIHKNLTEVDDENNMQFHIECCALSKRKLLQKENTLNIIPSDHLIEGYNKIKNTTINDLQDKYNLQFDTLVADCDGGLYYILQDEPNLLDQFSMIIVVNDYFDDEKRYFVEKLYQDKGFKRIYVEKHPQVNMPIDEFFFEVWVK